MIIVVGNKIDLEDRRAVTTEQGQKKATDLSVLFLECSASNGDNIGGLFRRAASDMPEEIPKS